MDEVNKELDLGCLEKYYTEGESCDSDVFAEMRSNILIMSGQHYQKTVGRNLSRGLRDLGVERDKRIRLVKNHTQKAINDAKDVVMSQVPGVLPFPAVEGELKHQKAAEIARQVLNHGRECNNWDDFREKSIDHFFEMGEVCSKIYFNPLKGGLKAFKQRVDLVDGVETPVYRDSLGNLTYQKSVMGPMGEIIGENEPEPDETKPEFYGQTVWEQFAPVDLLRPKGSKDIKTAPWLIYRKMIDNDILKGLINRSSILDEDQKKKAIEKISSNSGSTYRVFNVGMGGYEESENQSLLKEIYFRQSPKYPKGYFVIWTEYGKLFEGPIPFGEFGEIAYPIKWEGHDRFEGSARGFSPIKRVRPAQLEVNRCASKITEHQLTVGDDKVILNKGAKFERGADKPGIRVYYATGTAQVIAGRSGEQFVSYLEHNISEIYRLVNVDENKNPVAQAFDPKAELFKSQRQKIRFSKPCGKIERYFKSVAETYLFLEQKYMDEDRFKMAVGSSEAVNFEEFSSLDRLDYKVKIEEVSGDLETMMGKTMELETILQYAGKSLNEQTQLSLLMQFPILNRQNAFKHLTVQYKNIESDILQMERGKYVPARRFDDHKLVLQMLTQRMAQKDFMTLDPEVQEVFEAKYQEHEAVLKKQTDDLREANAGMIPTGGALVRCDVYENTDPMDPTKTSRMQFPDESLKWLKMQMDKQGLAQERLAEIADMQTQINILQGTGTEPAPLIPQNPMNPTIAY